MSDKIFQTEIRRLRESTGLNRKEFCEKLDIPYQTVTEWELGQRSAPTYVLRLLSYYITTRKYFSEQGIDELEMMKGEDYNGKDKRDCFV